MHSTEPQPSLTPSEVVYLAGDRFAPTRANGLEYNPVEGKSSVAAKDLAPAAYAAAFIALEGAALLRLTVRPKKALFGLRTTEGLYADPTGARGAFPDHSVESDLHKQAENLCKKQKHEVANLVYGVMWLESQDPFALALQPIRENLGKRSLLTATTTTHLKFIKSTKYSLPQSTAALAQEQVGQVQRMVEDYRTAHADVWQRLIEDICAGIRRRTEKEQSTPEFEAP